MSIPRCILTALIFIGLVGLPVTTTGEELRVLLTVGTPPLGYRNSNGEITGFNRDLSDAICRAMDVSCRYEVEAFNNILGKVETHSFDVGFGNFLVTPDRTSRVLFTAPLWRSASSLVGPSNERVEGKSAEEIISGRRLAIVSGSAQHHYAKKHWKKAILVEFATPQACFEAMRDQKADLTIQAMIMALPFLKSNSWGALSFIGPPLGDAGLGGTVHAVIPKSQPELKARFDRVLAELIADGTYHRISRQWMPFEMH